MMKPLESEEDEEDESKGWESHRPLLSGPDVSGATCSRRVRFHNGTGGGRGRVAFMAFLKRQQRRILDLVGKEGTEQKLHPPSPALQAIQEDDALSLSAAPNKDTCFHQWILDEMTRHRCYWYRASVIAIGYIFLSTFFNFDTLIEGRTAKSAYTEIYQFVVASPDVGYLDVIGTTHHLCKHHSTKYEANDLVLSLSSHKAKISASSVSERSRGEDESLLLARFLVGRKYWKQIVLPNETLPDQTSTTATIYDKRQGTTTNELPIWIDPTLSHHYESHALPPPPRITTSGGTRRISKGRRKKKFRTSSSSKSFLGVAVTLRTGTYDDDNSQCLEQRLKRWLGHYRNLGLEHFYILDNAGSDGPPIQLASDDIEGVIYIQTQMAYDDYNCHGDSYSPGRALVDNAILRAANVEWLFMLELDQLIVIPQDEYNTNHQVQDLPQLLHSILDENKKVGKEDNVTAFALHSSQVVGVQNRTEVFDTLLVKTSLANNDTSTDTTIRLNPSRYGWMAIVNDEIKLWCSPSYEESKYMLTQVPLV